MIDVDLRITLTAAQRNAWQTIKPILKAYLAKSFRLYLRANAEQRSLLRAHNPVLDAVVDMLGEVSDGDENISR